MTDLDDLHRRAAPESRWWLCPNGECDHGSVLHDVDELDDPSPTCCVDGCSCGQPPSPSTPNPPGDESK